MKYLIIALSFISQIVYADCQEKTSQEEVTGQLEINTNTPKHLKGATITVTRADGKSTTVPAEKFKVVARKQQFLTTKTKELKTVSCSNKDKNRLSILGGHGAQAGLKVDSTSAPSSISVESKVGLVGGLQYQRLITNKFSLGIQGQTNKTSSVVIGLDF